MGELGDNQQSASLSEATAGDGLEAPLTDPLRGLRPGHRCPLQCRLRRRIPLRWQRRRGAGIEGFDAAGRAFLGGASMQQLQAALTMSVRPSSPKGHGVLLQLCGEVTPDTGLPDLCGASRSRHAYSLCRTARVRQVCGERSPGTHSVLLLIA